MIMYMELYGTINEENRDARTDLHVLPSRMAEHMSCDAPPTKRQCSCVVDCVGP